MPFRTFLFTYVHLISLYIIQHSSGNMTTFFISRDKEWGLYKPFPIYKAFLKKNMADRAVPGWKGFWSFFQKILSLQEMLERRRRKKKNRVLGDARRSCVWASWWTAHFTRPAHSSLLYQFNTQKKTVGWNESAKWAFLFDILLPNSISFEHSWCRILERLLPCNSFLK